MTASPLLIGRPLSGRLLANLAVILRGSFFMVRVYDSGKAGELLPLNGLGWTSHLCVGWTGQALS